MGLFNIKGRRQDDGIVRLHVSFIWNLRKDVLAQLENQPLPLRGENLHTQSI